ncbi:hypothetical protein DXA34_03540 [[Clostridium] symbiosum]|nr:hypothetical protein DXA34_03540 [[Clostridium] symbiosum]
MHCAAKLGKTSLISDGFRRHPQQFIPAGFPLHDQPPTGTEDSAGPLTTPAPGRVLRSQRKSCSSYGSMVKYL